MTLFFLLLISLTFGTISTPPDSSLKDLDRIKKVTVKIAEKNNIPSFSLAISNPSTELGFSHNHPELKAQQIYGLGSTTKFLASVVLFDLFKKNSIDISTKLNDLISEDLLSKIEGANEIAVIELLNHTSGLSDYTKDPAWIQSAINSNAPSTFEEKLALVDDTLLNKGSFVYSNTNYLVLEKVAEAISNTSFDVLFNSFYSERGYGTISLDIPSTDTQAFFAMTDKSSSDVSAWKEAYGYDGGAYSTAKGLHDFIKDFFESDTILDNQTKSLITQWISMEPTTIPIGDKGKFIEYGNGLMKLKYGTEEYIGHFGGTLKYQSIALYDPDTGTTISILTNCAGRHYNNVFFQEMIPAILKELD